jgi:hypothetical protein
MRRADVVAVGKNLQKRYQGHPQFSFSYSRIDQISRTDLKEDLKDTHNSDFSYICISTSLTASGSGVRNTGA